MPTSTSSGFLSASLSRPAWALAADPAECTRYLAGPEAYAASVDGLTQEERDALVRLERDEMISLGLHPFVPHAFIRVLERMGLREAPKPGN